MVSMAVVTAVAIAAPAPLVTHFDNGATLVVLPDANASIASSYVFIRTGALFEGQWLGHGLSHYLEHLVAGGSTNLKSEAEYKSIINQLGGASNAYTTTDHTAYFIQSSSESVDTALQVLFEWVTQANWTNAEFEREKGVVLKEMDRAKRNVNRRIYQKTQALFYKDSPYRHPVIGYHESVRKTTSQDLKQYYRLQYVPENMVVVVGGNVSQQALVDTVKSTFGQLKATASPIRYQNNHHRILSKSHSMHQIDALQSPRIVIRYPIVTFYNDDVYPLDLLAFIFGHSDQSLMYQELVVKQKLATSVRVSSITPMHDTGYFEIVLESTHPPLQVIDQVQSFINQFSWRRIKQRHIKTAAQKKQAAFILSKMSLDDQIQEVGQAMMMGQDPLFFQFYAQSFGQVQSKDLTRVVQQYLSESRRQSYVFSSKIAQKESLNQPEKTPPSLEVLPNGVQVIHSPAINPQMVRITLHFKGGIQEETPSTNGIGFLASQLIGKKIKGKSREAFQTLFEARGANVDATLTHNTLVYSFQAPANAAVELVPQFMKGMTRFDVDDVLLNEAKTQLLTRIQKKNEDWFSEAYDTVKANMVAPPYAFPLTGTSDTVQPLTVDHVVAYVRRRWQSSELVVGIQAANPGPIIARMFPILNQRANAQPTVLKSPKLNAPKSASYNLEQAVGAVIRVDPLATPITSLRDHITFKLVDALLSGMRYPSGLLHHRLRGAQLVYVVHALPVQWGESHMLLTYALTEPHQVIQVSDIINESVGDIQAGFTSKQLADAKSQVVFDYLSTQADMASQMAYYIQSVHQLNAIPTLEEVTRLVDNIQMADIQRFIKEQFQLPHEFTFNATPLDDRTRIVR